MESMKIYVLDENLSCEQMLRQKIVELEKYKVLGLISTDAVKEMLLECLRCC